MLVCHEFDWTPYVAIAQNTTTISTLLADFEKDYFARRQRHPVCTLEFGLDLSLAAQQMGHSVQVHSDLYHAWISDSHHQKAYDAIMKRSDRPKPPV